MNLEANLGELAKNRVVSTQSRDSGCEPVEM